MNSREKNHRFRDTIPCATNKSPTAGVSTSPPSGFFIVCLVQQAYFGLKKGRSLGVVKGLALSIGPKKHPSNKE